MLFLNVHVPDNSGASPVAQVVRNLPAAQELQVWSLRQEDPLEEEMATHSSILAWRIPWTEEPGGVRSQTWLKWLSMHTLIIHEVNNLSYVYWSGRWFLGNWLFASLSTFYWVRCLNVSSLYKFIIEIKILFICSDCNYLLLVWNLIFLLLKNNVLIK